MQCLHEMVDVVKDKYPNATVYEVCGHIHAIPEKETMVETPEKTFIVPVGIDKKTLLGRTVVITQDKIEKVDYQVE